MLSTQNDHKRRATGVVDDTTRLLGLAAVWVDEEHGRQVGGVSQIAADEHRSSAVADAGTNDRTVAHVINHGRGIHTGDLGRSYTRPMTGFWRRGS